MQLSPIVLIDISLLLSLLLLVKVEAYIRHGGRYQNDSTVLSPWLKKDEDNHGFHPHDPGCRSGKPFVCKKGQFPPAKMKCCRNRCVDVGSDINNCGFCGKSCSFPRQCCRGFCVNTNVSRFNCGKCGNKCPFHVRCAYGMCGYGQPGPRPRPPKGHHPRPPPEGHHRRQPPKGHRPPAAATDYQSFFV